MASTSAIGDDLTDEISIVEGSPGTSKTRVIEMTAVSCLSENRKFLVAADTRYAVRVAAEAISNDNRRPATTAGLCD